MINFKPDNIIEWRKKMEEKDKAKIVPKMNLGLLLKINPDSDEDSSSSEFMFPYQDNLSDDEIDFDFDSDISYTFNCKREQALKISFSKEGIEGIYSEVYSIKEIQEFCPIFDGEGYEILIELLEKSPETLINDHEFENGVYLNLNCLIQIKGFPMKYEFDICLCKEDEVLTFESEEESNDGSNDESDDNFPFIFDPENDSEREYETKEEANWTLINHLFAPEA